MVAQEQNHDVALDAAAYIAIYPIEARGLQALRAGIGQSRAPSPIATTPGVFQDEGIQEAMEEIAQRTGGRAFVRTNDISRAIRSAIDESRMTYTLGFYPESTRFDGQFHRITVKLADRHDVSLRYRRGYVDMSDPAKDPSQRKRDLEAAASSPLDANAVPLTARFARSTTGNGFRLTLTIGLSGLNLQPNGEYWIGEADVFLVQKDQHGGELSRVAETISMQLKQATYEQMLKTGVPYQREIEPNLQAERLRIIVRDGGSGEVGSLSVPIAAIPRP